MNTLIVWIWGWWVIETCEPHVDSGWTSEAEGETARLAIEILLQVRLTVLCLETDFQPICLNM